MYISKQAIKLKSKPWKYNATSRSIKSSLFSLNTNDHDYCHTEWTQLNSHVFFRPTFTNYFLDLNQLKMFYSCHSNYNYSLIINIQISIKETIYIYHKTSEYVSVRLYGHDKYAIHSLTTNIILKNLLPHEHIDKINNFKTDINMQVFVSTPDGLHKTKYPIKVRIKNFRENNSLKQKAIICSKHFYFEPSYAKTFIWWIELNRMHGYDKLVFFNHSIPNTPEIVDAFKRNADFIEIKQLQCYPNFMEENNTNRSFLRVHDFKNIFKVDPFWYHFHLESFCFNECLFDNIDKYVHIAVFDQDESILPRRIDKFAKISSDTYIRTGDFDKIKCSESSQWISSYFKELNHRLDSSANYDKSHLKNVSDFSYHFLMTLYLKHSTIRDLFNELNKYFKYSAKFNNSYSFELNDLNDVNQHGKKGVRFQVFIDNEGEHSYARALYDLYKKRVAPFLERNSKTFQDMPEVFSRLFLVGNRTTSWMCGKTIHNTQNVQFVSTHYPEGNNQFKNMVWTPQEYGHVSHFRSSLKDLNERNVSIYHIQFDLNYFNCYLKPICKKLNYGLIF